MAGPFLVIFALFWSGIVLMFDGIMVHGAYKQFEAGHYSSVAGTITHSEVTSHSTSKGGTSYSADIEYRYEVGGQKYAGNKLRFGLAASDYATASATVSDHPAGSPAAVFYNPADPQEAILFPGIKGSDLMFALFLTPFNMVMFGFWAGLGAWLRERFFRPVAGGVKIIADGMATRIRLPQFPALGWGLATTGGLGFASIFIVGFSTRMAPSMPLILTAIAVVYGAGLAVYLWQRQKIGTGIDDLILNESSRSLELPLTFGRKERITVNLADIRYLAVDKIEHRGNKGGVSYTYAPTLGLHKAEPASQKLADWSDELKAKEFTEWLRGKLGPNIPADCYVTDPDDQETNESMAAPPATAGEIRPVENSKIRVTEGPAGREFYFPAARNLGAAFFSSIFFLALAAGLYEMIAHHFFVVFEVFLGFVVVITGGFSFSAWFKTSRVTVNPGEVTVRNGYLFFSRTRRISAGDILRFQAAVGMINGGKVYQDIKLITRAAGEGLAARMAGLGGQPQLRSRLGNVGGITIASSIASKQEAAWLAQEMNRALGRATKNP